MVARIESIAIPPDVFVRPLSLDAIVDQCTMVKAMIEASVQDLARVNRALGQDLADHDCQPAAADAALKRTELIETRLNEAVQVLSVVSMSSCN